MNKYDDFNKVLRTIKSCETQGQLLVALKMYERFFKIHCLTLKDDVNKSLILTFITHPLIKELGYTCMAQVKAYCLGRDYYWRLINGKFVRHNLETCAPVTLERPPTCNRRSRNRY